MQSRRASYQNSGVQNAATNLGITVSLLDPNKNTGEARGDTYISIERLRGSSFNDFLEGDKGNNALEGRAGADKLDGLDGFDYARYNSSPAVSGPTGILASLADPTKNTGDAKGDTYFNIEGLWGSDFNDTLIGDNKVSAAKIAGTETFISNVLVGGPGGDALKGGDGIDIAAYFTSPVFGGGGVVANLANPALNSGDAAGD